MADFNPGYQEAAGVDANQNIINNWYHNQAQNALNQMYGPIAGNPQGALQMQQYNYLQAQDPQYVQQLRLENQLNAGMMPSRIQNNQGIAAQNTAAGAVAQGTVAPRIASDTASLNANAATAGPMAQAGLGSAQAGAQVAQIGAAQAAGYQHIGAATAFARAAEDTLAGGGDANAAYATGMQAVQAAGGVDPNDPAFSPQAKQAFLASPQTTIDQLRSVSLAAQNAQLSKMNPAQRNEFLMNNLKFQQQRTDLIKGAHDNFQNARDVEDGFLAQQGPIGVQTASIHAAQDSLANIDKLVADIPTNGLSRAATEFLPGSAITQLQEQAQTVRAALSLNQMSALKSETGGASSGIRNTAEFEAAGEALANFDPKNMTAGQLKQQIANARNYLTTAGQIAERKVASLNDQYGNIIARRKALEADYNHAIGLTPETTSGLSSEAQPSAGGGAAKTPPVSSPAAPGATPPGAAAGSQGDWQKAAASVGITPAQMATMSPSEVQQFKQLAAGGAAPGVVGGGRDALAATTANYARDVPASSGGASPMAQAIWGQESGNKGNPTSIDGAIGPGQVMPSTFAAYARPGENINNPDDNRAVSARILADYAQRYGGDPARVATAYFSGPSNVAPAGSPTPWLRDARDGNGKSVSGYVGDVMERLHGAPITAAAPAQAAAPQPTTAGFPPSAVPPAQSQQPGSDVLGAQPSQTPQRPLAPTDANRAGTGGGTGGGSAATQNIGPVGSLEMTGQNAALTARLAAAQARNDLAKAPESVMAGRALLAKYLNPQQRTA